MKCIFYESLIARIQLWAVFFAIGMLGLFIPIFKFSTVFRLVIYFTLFFSSIFIIRAFFVKRAIITLDKREVIFRGVKPGIWKIFQMWVIERIEDNDVISIRLGRIREKKLGKLILYPVGEPSKNAAFQRFLWIRYKKNGQPEEIYYPHLNDIANYQELITCLESRYGAKVEKFNL